MAYIGPALAHEQHTVTAATVVTIDDVFGVDDASLLAAQALTLTTTQPLRVLYGDLSADHETDPSPTLGQYIPSLVPVKVMGQRNLRGLKMITDSTAVGDATVDITLHMEPGDDH